MQTHNAALSLAGCGLFALALTAACGEGEAQQKPIADLFPGTAVELPPPLARLSLGMARADAETTVPNIAVRRVKLEGYADVWADSSSTQMGDTEVLTKVEVWLPRAAGDIKTMLSEKWGAPRWNTDTNSAMWFNPEQGLRASLKDFGDNKLLLFSAYMPFEKLLGTDKAKFGFETTPLLGLDFAGLSKDYGQVLTVLDEARASTALHLPPTELERLRTTVWPRFNKETGRIESLRMLVPFDAEEGAADRMMAAMKAVWGEPREEDPHGRPRFVFSEEPFITVKDRSGMGWEIEKETARK